MSISHDFNNKSLRKNQSRFSKRFGGFEALESRLLLSISPLPGMDELAPMPDNPLDGGSKTGTFTPSTSLLPSYTTQPNGLPILNSRSGAPMDIFMDFNNTTVQTPYNTDSDPTTFNASEQADITLSWQNVATYFSFFNVNVTTAAPTTQYFSWIVLSPTVQGGYSYCFINQQGDTFPAAYDEQGDVLGRPSAIIHELGHNYGLAHQSAWDLAGNNIADYSGRIDDYHGVMMGVDYDGIMSRWINGHADSSNTVLQDDIAIIAANIVAHGDTSGDGFAPDDYPTATFAGASTLSTVSSTIQAKAGIIERLTDQDYFSFTSAGGWMNVSATRSGLPFADLPAGSATLNGTLPGISTIDVKMDVYDAAHNLIGESDDITDPDAVLNLNLAAGTYYVVVSSHGNYDDQGPYVVMAQSLPVPNQPTFGLTFQNIGPAGRGETASYDSSTGTWTLKSASGDIWDRADGINYTYQQVTGNSTITARITSLTNTNGWAKAGVMFRESLDPGSREAGMLLTPSNGKIFAWRPDTGGYTSGYYPTAASFTPTWLRLVRSGNNFSAYFSSDGSNWTQWGSTQTVSMAATIYVGLAVGGQNRDIDNPLGTATFTNLSILGTLGPASTTSNGLAAPGNLTAALGTGSGLNLAWSSVSGATNYAIDRSDDGINFQQIASGITATNYADANLTGSARWWYRVRALNASAGTSPASTVASIINRPGTPTHFTMFSLQNSYVLNWWDIPVSGETGYRIERSLDGVNFTTLANVGKNVPSYNDVTCRNDTTYYYRVIPTSALGDGNASAVITRVPAAQGFTVASLASNQIVLAWSDVSNATGFRLFRSTNGSNWTTIDIPAHTTSYADTSVTPSSAYYYRLFPLSGTSLGAVSQQITTATPGVAQPPAPWVSQDIGAVTGTGSTGYNSGTFTLVSSGTDIWDPADQFRFVYQTLNGNGSIVAQVTSQQNTGGWAKEGVMIRNSLSPTSQYAFTALTPSNGAAFQYRAATGGGASHVAGPSVTAPYWVKLTRSGTTFTSQVSTDGTTWTTIGSTNISMNTMVYIGLAADANSSNTLNTSTFANVTFTPSSSTAPTIIAPAAASAAIVTGKSVNLSVLATDDYGEAYLTYSWSVTGKPSGANDPILSANGTNAAKNTTATFSQSGVYTFTATITDAFGLSTTSAAVSVNVVRTSADIVISPASLTFSPSTTGSFYAAIADQFGIPLGVQPSFTWSASAGAINSNGNFTAPSSAGAVTITAQSGSMTGTATAMVLANPQGWWRFDSNSGDSSGKGNTGISTGVGYTAGVLGNAAYLNSTTANIRVNNSATLNPTTAITLAAWINPDTWTAATTNNARIFQKGANDNQYRLLAEGGLLKFDLAGVGAITAALPSTGAWHYVAATYTQGDKMRLYVDRVLVAESSIAYSAAIATTTDPLYIGNKSGSAPSAGNDDSFHGKIDDARLYNYALTANDVATLSRATPTVVTPAAISPKPVTGTTASLSVLGGDGVLGEAILAYRWMTTSAPTGAAAPTFSLNGNNAAKNTTITFAHAGTYMLKVIISDPSGGWASSSVSVSVNQTLTSIAVTPAVLSLDFNGTQTLTAVACDQFGDAMAVQPSFTWSAARGTIDAGGLYTAPGSVHGPDTVTATNGSIDGSAAILVANAAPTVATAAAASPSVVTGKTTSLSALGADDDGEANLIYTWAATSLPAGAAAPTFSENGTNVAKNATATFSQAGAYAFTVTITDAGELNVTSTVNVTVNQTYTAVTLSPALVYLLQGGNQTFTAVARDQFGNAMASQPSFSWSATAGSITSGGLFTAGAATSATISAQSSSIKGSAVADITMTPTMNPLATPQVLMMSGTPQLISLSGISSGAGTAVPLQIAATSSNPALLNPSVIYTPGSNFGTLVLNPTDNEDGKTTVTVTARSAGFDGAFGTADDGLLTQTISVYVINNTAPQATVTASSASAGAGHQPSNVADGIIGIQDTGEWASNGQTNPWITLTWTTPRTISGVILYDRNNLTDFAPGGTLTFSNNTSVGVTGISNNGTAKIVEFTPRTVTWVKFQVTGGSGANVGLSEFQVMQNAAPTIAAAATASPSPVTGTTTALSVLGADFDGGSEAYLTYTWAATTVPSGAAAPSFSVNGTNAAKNTIATFTKAGTYVFAATITDLAGFTTISSVSVTVNQTLTDIVVSPLSTSLLPGRTNQFTAVGSDQFGNALTSQPSFTWTASAGSITASGLFTAPLTSNVTATITAAVGPIAGTASAIIGDDPPTDILLSNSTVNENQSGAAIGLLTAVDPNLGETYAYSLVNDPTNQFEIVGNALKLKNGQSLDFETTPSVHLTLRTSDGTLSFDKAFTISVVDQAETLTIAAADWTGVGLTLTLDTDGKLHVYRTGTTTDAVPPHNPANVTGLDVTGRGLGDVLAVDSLGWAIPRLDVTQTTVNLNAGNVFAAAADVTVNGGVLNFTGSTNNIHNLTLAADGQANLADLNSATTNVASGVLTATSIVSDSLTIGSASQAASAPAKNENSNAASYNQYSAVAIVPILWAGEDSREGEAPAEPIAVQKIPTPIEPSSSVVSSSVPASAISTASAPFAEDSSPIAPSAMPIEMIAIPTQTIASAVATPLNADPLPQKQLPSETPPLVSQATSLDSSLNRSFSSPILTTKQLKDTVFGELAATTLETKKYQPFATSSSRNVQEKVWQSFAREYQNVATALEDSDLPVGRRLRSPEKVAKAVDTFLAAQDGQNLFE